nr:integrase, catalytic region, zinc finger, CCHC-type, peptidase aspartic, catalytic [Tanacetum cinerariifolium]
MHMTRNRSQLTNFVNKFLGTVKFGNDKIAKIVGYSDYQIENVTISKVYYVEGLGHNLFFVGQFCDSDLEVAFCKHKWFVRDLEGVELLMGYRGTNLYTLFMGDMMKSSLICILLEASKTKSWLWHRRLSQFKFGTINQLAKQGLVREAIAITCYTQNHSLIRLRHGKTPYELLHNRKPDLLYLHVFGALCYPTNDSKDLGKLKAKADDILFQPLFDEYFNPPPSVDHPVPEVAALEPSISTGTPSLTFVDQDAPSPSTSQTLQELPYQVISLGAKEADHDIEVSHMDNDPYFESLTESCWIEAMQEELNEFECLEVWELVPRLDCVMIITLKWIYKAKPIEKHLHAVKQIFQYLRGTINMGLWYLKKSCIALTAYADANHAGCKIPEEVHLEVCSSWRTD